MEPETSIPGKKDPRWANLVTGKTTHSFHSVPAGLCVSRNVRQYRMDPQPAQLEAAVDEIHAFFVKYHRILENDIVAIFG